MKKITAILLGTLIASSAALAQTNQVLSKNAVGYVKINLAKGFNMIQNSFDSLGAPIAISNTFASLPNQSRVHFWNGSTYVTIGRTLGGWGAAGSNVLNRGQGFWVEIPQAAASNTYTVFLMGEVPDDATKVVSVIPGFNMVGVPYPVATKFGDTRYAAVAPNQTRLHVWNGTGYDTYSRTLGGWGATTNLVLQPGQGFWMQYPVSFVATNLNLSKPYTWP